MATPYSNRCYVIFNTCELQSVDFNQVYETSADTVRKSVDGSKTFVKFDIKKVDVAEYTDEASHSIVEPIFEIQTPSSIAALTTKSQLYTHEEILSILSTSDWVDSNTEI